MAACNAAHAWEATLELLDDAAKHAGGLDAHAYSVAMGACAQASAAECRGECRRVRLAGSDCL